MTNHMPFANHLGQFLIYAGIIFFLLLLVVVPVRSQNPIPAQPGQSTQPFYQEAPPALILFLAVQFLFLVVFLVSYLVDPKRLLRLTEWHVPHRWHEYLHLP
jgi:hypothetical protein